ncbi:MAG: 2-phospho-L-lactate transferase CofD family protein [Thaumarchaeota archaeon]|nr:2-phospho-L-lactate transferase CofD family protein [Nitrososphaerota archaeon]
MKGSLGVICGGSGSSKFARAISSYCQKIQTTQLGFVANVADNFWYHGLFVCPDIDIITYALSGRLDNSKGWGLNSDGLLANQQLSEIENSPEWFSLGDKDFAMSLRRTELLRDGWKLSSITNHYCEIMRTSYPIHVASDDFLQTFILTILGKMHLQEYWVKKRASLEPLGVEYLGHTEAKPNQLALESCSNNVIICPANPVTSILPTISLKGFARKLSRAKVIGISPFVGNKPFSGPAAKLMGGLGIESNSLGVAKLYSKYLKLFFVDEGEDPKIVNGIRDLSIECVKTNTKLDDVSTSSIAEELIGAF